MKRVSAQPSFPFCKRLITVTCCLALAVAHVLRFIATALHDVLRKAPSEAVLLDNYPRVCVILSEIINEVCFSSCIFTISAIATASS